MLNDCGVDRKSRDAFKDCQFSSAPGVPRVPLDPIGLDFFEECFDNGVVISIPLATHGYFFIHGGAGVSYIFAGHSISAGILRYQTHAVRGGL